MKIKIEVDLAMDERKTLLAVSGALLKTEVTELLKAFSPGEHFKMERPEGSIIITKL